LGGLGLLRVLDLNPVEGLALTALQALERPFSPVGGVEEVCELIAFRPSL
jgi:hypothetical protein